MNMNTQKAQVLAHLKKSTKGGITPQVAFERYGIMRLSAVIFKLRKDGHRIVTDDVTGKNRFGHNVRYARYRLVG